VLQGAELDTVRAAYDILVERQIARWDGDDPSGNGGQWTSSAQPRLNLWPDPQVQKVRIFNIFKYFLVFSNIFEHFLKIF
jgi:hypothetical protein